jgi:hypothetical protein
MGRTWHTYQQEVAALFRSLGLNTEIEAVVEGARGTHKIDVWVRFSRFGVEMKWLVECKFWRRAVPKEKVLTLQQIAQDVGADRAFLFSELGFQSGAIQAAQLSNTTLTSLAELRDRAVQDLYEAQLAAVVQKLNSFTGGALDLSYYDPRVLSELGDEDRGLILSAAGVLLMLKLAIPEAIGMHFPVFLRRVFDSPELTCTSAEQFVDAVSTVLDDLALAEDRIRTAAHIRRQRAHINAVEFVNAVGRIMEIAEIALFTAPAHAEFNAERLRALDAMKEVDRTASLVRQDADGVLLRQIKATMRLLIDTVYLHLTQPTVATDVWVATKEAVTEHTLRIRMLLNGGQGAGGQ